MPKVNEKKLELYANKLYNGDLTRYKKKTKKDDLFSISLFLREEEKIRRISTTKSQEKTVAKSYKNKCAVCGKPYEDRDDFDFHHINGDRSKTVTSNLVLLCLGCHRKIHTRAKAKLKDHKVRTGGRKKPKGPFDLPDIKPIKFKPPKFKF